MSNLVTSSPINLGEFVIIGMCSMFEVYRLNVSFYLGSLLSLLFNIYIYIYIVHYEVIINHFIKIGSSVISRESFKNPGLDPAVSMLISKVMHIYI